MNRKEEISSHIAKGQVSKQKLRTMYVIAFALTSFSCFYNSVVFCDVSFFVPSNTPNVIYRAQREVEFWNFFFKLKFWNFNAFQVHLHQKFCSSFSYCLNISATYASMILEKKVPWVTPFLLIMIHEQNKTINVFNFVKHIHLPLNDDMIISQLGNHRQFNILQNVP